MLVKIKFTPVKISVIQTIDYSHGCILAMDETIVNNSYAVVRAVKERICPTSYC